ncbi:SMAD/FHA domain [Plasmopara halstedii]|uniref:SMAD/FHA domain n=1 Tax=Plasmopara halstedii TaxID=4781 RepID=A0A0P1AF34_PLAHL|nr:SMAD/FHA domain [Plasmopara halstedii]CEG39289.1 SMAD/FHA domain [Plasmopara halstedii]|eukprot:XP_024575658.1 SMAD/FHA domain [Plasmopara halstedii]
MELAEPWGRFTLVSKDVADDNDHIYFRNEVTTIGRNKRRCDFVIEKLFISSVHCVVKLDGTGVNGKRIVIIEDNSRNGIWVNADRVGKGASVTLDSGYTIHFTKPGSTPAGVTPMAYKFEFLNFHDSRLPRRKEIGVREDMIDMTTAAEEVFEATQLTTPLDLPSSLGKKRKREEEISVHANVAMQKLDSKSKEKDTQTRTIQTELETAINHTATIGQEREQSMQAKVDKIVQENLDLMSRLEAATTANLQLKTELTAKDNNIAIRIKEAVEKSMKDLQGENQGLREEIVVINEAIEARIIEAVNKRVAADEEIKANDFDIKLAEAIMKYKKKVEAENFEQQREVSDKMLAYVNENEKLLAMLRSKNEKLIEYKDQISRLKEKVNQLEKMNDNNRTGKHEEKNGNTFSFKNEINGGAIHTKTDATRDGNLEIVGLETSAEHIVIAPESKTSESMIATGAGKPTCGASYNERHGAQTALVPLCKEDETNCINYKEELKEQQNYQNTVSATKSTTESLTSVAKESITSGDDKELLHGRLAIALSLFSQVQVLGLQAASVASTTSISLSSTFDKEAQQQTGDAVNDSSVNKLEKALAKNTATETDDIHDETDEAAAETKASPSKLKCAENTATQQIVSLLAKERASVCIDNHSDGIGQQ